MTEYIDLKDSAPSGLLSEVDALRSENNKAWKRLVQLALQSSPLETRQLFREIEQNDRKIQDAIRAVYGNEEDALIARKVSSGD